MDFLDWIPAISTSSLLVVAIWLMRSVITTRLTKSVQYEFDKKLEVLRTDQRKSEEAFKADLRAKDAQTDLFRSGAILCSRKMRHKPPTFIKEVDYVAERILPSTGRDIQIRESQ